MSQRDMDLTASFVCGAGFVALRLCRRASGTQPLTPSLRLETSLPAPARQDLWIKQLQWIHIGLQLFIKNIQVGVVTAVSTAAQAALEIHRITLVTLSPHHIT